MKKITAIAMGLVLAFTMISCGVNEQASSTEETTGEDAEQGIMLDGIGKFYVELDVESFGIIKLELDGDVAPITVANFVKLAEEGFYDGLTFHRIIDGFMIQGGDPLGNGTGGSDENIVGEFSANGIQNNIEHVRGVISMARSQAMDSASSQFFIMHEDSPHLDGSYAGFGMVTEGIEVVDAIVEATQVEDGNGTVASGNQPTITSIKILN